MDHKHAILYDNGDTEYLNLVTTARKWVLDDSKPPGKGTAGQQGQAKNSSGAKAEEQPDAAKAASSRPKKPAAAAAAAVAAAGDGKAGRRPQGARLVGHVIEVYKRDQDIYEPGTVQVGRAAPKNPPLHHSTHALPQLQQHFFEVSSKDAEHSAKVYVLQDVRLSTIQLPVQLLSRRQQSGASAVGCDGQCVHSR